ncbi:MAG: hypothetical protein EBZ48_10005, partial [Proteobacteria bacterium]|nr:hypothetical protein [Pseudomonadota bacterium]
KEPHSIFGSLPCVAEVLNLNGMLHAGIGGLSFQAWHDLYRSSLRDAIAENDAETIKEARAQINRIHRMFKGTRVIDSSGAVLPPSRPPGPERAPQLVALIASSEIPQLLESAGVVGRSVQPDAPIRDTYQTTGLTLEQCLPFAPHLTVRIPENLTLQPTYLLTMQPGEIGESRTFSIVGQLIGIQPES